MVVKSTERQLDDVWAKVKEMAKAYDITVIVAQEPGEAARLRREQENSRVREGLMPQRVVVQPNGKYAYFSTVVDDFVHYDADREGMLKVLAEEYQLDAF